MNWNWRTGLLAQAQSDYRMFLKLKDFPELNNQSYRLHFLQMATEKLAKGLMSNGITPAPQTHKAFQKFVQKAHRHERVRKSCGFENDIKGFINYLKSIQNITQFIENLAPSGLETPNPEYPWEKRKFVDNSIKIVVYVPYTYAWPEWDTHLPEIVKLLEFLKCCFKAVEQELAEFSV
ncbi:hypothetical protein MHK_005950 [Candidatus Magnetomorum sp. HK-1]|nr:hypothetical protein MHK_005950 [Candidatus Magnetomorum sp. HK-1]